LVDPISISARLAASLPGADADPDRLATALLVALQGGLLLTQVRRDTVALEAGLDTVIDHVAALTVR
jgi:hypothetical protein